MNILVIGATGGTGQALVAEGAARGERVTAFARRPEQARQRFPLARISPGDILDAASVDRAVAGQDAVLCALGPQSRSDGRTQSEGTRNLVHAMQAHGVRRLVLLSSVGVGESRAQARFVSTFFFPLFLRAPFADKERQEQLVVESGLDWVIVRPTHLTDAPAAPRIAVATDFRTRVGWRIPRANVARFMLDQLYDDRLLGTKPTIGGAGPSTDTGAAPAGR